MYFSSGLSVESYIYLSPLSEYVSLGRTLLITFFISLIDNSSYQESKKYNSIKPTVNLRRKLISNA